MIDIQTSLKTKNKFYATITIDTLIGDPSIVSGIFFEHNLGTMSPSIAIYDANGQAVLGGQEQNFLSVTEDLVFTNLVYLGLTVGSTVAFTK